MVIVVVLTVVSYSQISLLKLELPLSILWAGHSRDKQNQQGLLPAVRALWFRISGQEPFLHLQTWAVGRQTHPLGLRGGLCPGDLGLVVGLSP